jgi:hypothetical protein
VHRWKVFQQVTRAARFTSADLTRAIKAFEKAGLCVSRARVAPDGSIEVVAGSPDMADNTNWFSGSPLYKDAAA